MHTRIRYIKKENLLVTKENYLGKDHILRVEIDTTTMSFKVLSTVKEDKPEKVIAHGAAKTLVEVKKHVKATLKGLGVPFNEEVRDRTSPAETADNGASEEAAGQTDI